MFVDNEYVLTTTVRNYEKEYFLRTLLQHYEHISHCLPDDFFVKCWEYIFIPHKINGHSKNILLLCSPDNLTKIIGILKTKTVSLNISITNRNINLLKQKIVLKISKLYIKKI